MDELINESERNKNGKLIRILHPHEVWVFSLMSCFSKQNTAQTFQSYQSQAITNYLFTTTVRLNVNLILICLWLLGRWGCRGHECFMRSAFDNCSSCNPAIWLFSYLNYRAPPNHFELPRECGRVDMGVCLMCMWICVCVL